MEPWKHRKKGRSCLSHALLLVAILILPAWLILLHSQRFAPTILPHSGGLWAVPASIEKPPQRSIPSGFLQDHEERSVKDNLESTIPGFGALRMSSTLIPPTPAIALHMQFIANASGRSTGATVPSQVKKRSSLLDDPYHNWNIFKKDYSEMLRSFKIYVYPYKENDTLSKAFMPMDGEPTGNYASESYLKKVLLNSNFTTSNASEADMFFLPFSISKLRHEKQVGVHKLDKFISSYMEKVKQKWPYWNLTSGVDHFFVSCHSITKVVTEKVSSLRNNAIQVVCSSNIFLQGYVPHKDVAMPQIWPRKGTPPETKLVKQRKVLAFFAGSANSPVREALVQVWAHDKDILVYPKRISMPYAQALLTSKFCLHVKGYEVNTARIADAIHFGCVPVIIANHYNLPFANILKWDAFSLVVTTSDIPLLKSILQAVTQSQYKQLQKNVVKVRRHFQWTSPPHDYDAFHLVMYELWSRRYVLKPSI